MASVPLYSETELLAKIAAGEEHAFSILYNQYYQKTYKFAYSLLLDDSAAQEIIQESMLYIWQHSYKLTEVQNFEAYLKTIAKHKAIAVFRSKQVKQKAAKILAGAYSETHNETEVTRILKETREILKKAIRQLPKQQQQVYRLCREQGMKYEEAAELPNLSHGTVQTHMKLALKHLREQVGKHTDITVLLIILKLF